ncbi:hypothetical protein [Frigidibacter oleivorans]|uniref:hypothetical protein n=1 Tax=Frigidibacter oleivorans TaxID=2487129 RepID=UPI000F8CEBA0|nr:hypothetical protein [Frigidibacter oleivorans]
MSGPDGKANGALEVDPDRLLRLEAQILAQRRLMMRLIAVSGLAQDLEAALAERDTFAGHDEDPGLIPDQAFALQAALAEENRRLGQELAGVAAGLTAGPGR